MYLTERQTMLFEDNMSKLKRGVVTRSGLSETAVKGISTYGKREITTIFMANKDFTDNNVSGDNIDPNVLYSKELLFEELAKISAVIKKHPRLINKFLTIKENIDLLVKMEEKNCSEADEFREIVISNIVRLQAALGITPSVYFYDIVEDLANELYMDVVNHHYKDPYVKTR